MNTLTSQRISGGYADLVVKGAQRLAFRLSDKKTNTRAALVFLNNGTDEKVLVEGRFSAANVVDALPEIRNLLDEPALDAGDVCRFETRVIETETKTETTHLCLCGCGLPPAGKRRKFLQGHDAKLRSRVLKGDLDGLSDEAIRVGTVLADNHRQAQAAKEAANKE